MGFLVTAGEGGIQIMKKTLNLLIEETIALFINICSLIKIIFFTVLLWIGAVAIILSFLLIIPLTIYGIEHPKFLIIIPCYLFIYIVFIYMCMSLLSRSKLTIESFLLFINRILCFFRKTLTNILKIIICILIFSITVLAIMGVYNVVSGLSVTTILIIAILILTSRN